MWYDQIWCIDSIISAILLAAMIVIVGISHISRDKDTFHQADDKDNLSKKNI